MVYISSVILAFSVMSSVRAHEIPKIDKPHPRLIWHEEEVTDVIDLIASDSIYNKVHKNIIQKCNQIIIAPHLERKLEGSRLLDVSRESRQRIMILSYGYRMTKEEKYAERAIQEMLNVCRFSDWNPSHFLDVAEISMGLAVGYDWLYEKLNENQRKEIENAIKEKAFSPAADKKYSRFYRDTNNWNSVCNSGLVFGAISLFEKMPEEASLIIAKALDTNTQAMYAFAPDGGYPEGCGYWGYGTSFEVLLIDALSKVYGHDFGLSRNPGFLQTAGFMQFMEAPSGMCFNYSDNASSMPLYPAYWWFAYQNKDNSLLDFIYRKLGSNIYNVADKGFLPLTLIFAARLKSNSKVGNKEDENFWFSRGATPIFAYRQGWNSKGDAYLAVKGGSAYTPHAHMDAGAFIYEKNGIRWAMDLVYQNYYSLEKEGIDLWNRSQTSQRWDVLRMRNEYHNTLTIDSGRHIVNAKAEILDTLSSPKQKGAIVDLTSTLGKVKNATRTIFLNENNDLKIIDSISTTQYTNLMWVMVTPAKPTILNGNSIILEMDDHKMLMSIDSPIDVTPHIWSNVPIHHYDAPNPGSCRVGYSVKIPKDSSIKIIVEILDSL